jgi:CPA2 family monovalent cation:H+ antiporter-2
VIIKFDLPIQSQVIFFIEVAFFIIFTIYLLPRIISRYFNRKSHKPKEGDLKFIIAVLVGVVALGYLIGLHGIVAAFLVGIVIGEFIPSKESFDKIHGIGHGFLIPVFFIVLGMQLDIGILSKGIMNIIFPIALIGTLILSKIFGGLVYATIKKLSIKQGIILGMVLWPQLSATIAATAIGYETGLFDQSVLVSVVIMALFSTIGTPFTLRFLTRKDDEKIIFKNHTIIAGYGRISAKITHILNGMNVPLVVIDKDAVKLRKLSNTDIVTIYGNIASPDILDRAKIQTANLIFLSIDNEHELYISARKIRKQNPKCHIIVRIHTEQSYNKLKKENLLDEYIWPEKRSAHDVADKVISKIIQWEQEVMNNTFQKY